MERRVEEGESRVEEMESKGEEGGSREDGVESTRLWEEEEVEDMGRIGEGEEKIWMK